MRTRWTPVLTVILATLFVTQAYGWNDRGHMMVAAVAWDMLKPATRARAVELLKRNPDYQDWIANVPKKSRDKVAFVMAATWPDAIKGDAAYQKDGDEPEQSPDPTRNTGYDDHFQHRYWHYIDLPFSADGTPLIQPKEPNAQTQIEAFRAVLASDAGDDKKSYDMVWLLHLVGDVHQPLHATSRFSHDLPQGDRGGNDVLLCVETHCGAKLHAFWDDILGINDNPLPAIRAASNLEEAPSAAGEVTSVRQWIEDSFALAKTWVYRPPVGADHGPFTITDAYKRKARDLAEDRVALAGARLAKLLNDNLR